VKKMRLTIDIEYDTQGIPGETLKKILAAIPERAASNGSFSGYTPAEVESWSYSIQDITDEKPAAARKPRILVVVNRGLCEQVVTDAPADVLLRDLDDNCTDPDDVIREHIMEADVDPDRVNKAFEY